MAEVSETGKLIGHYNGQRLETELVLDVRTHFKPTETFQYTLF